MGSSDVSRLTFEEICDLCRRYSRSQAKSSKGPRITLSKVTKSTTSGVTMIELGNLLENFKTNFIGTLSLQLDTLQIKRNKKMKKQLFPFFVLNVEKNTH
jgi:hypothetical protein